MTSPSTTPWLPQSEIETAEHLFDNWFDPIEAGLRDRAREFLQAMLEAELDEVLDRSRYARRAKRSTGDLQEPAGVSGHRHGHRSRTLLGTFGRLRSRCRAPGWIGWTVRQRSGRARRCGPISAVRWRPTR